MTDDPGPWRPTLGAVNDSRLLVCRIQRVRAGGSTAKAREALSAAADRWAASGRAWEGAWALVDLAEAHRRANQGAAAVTAAQAAFAAADRLSADRIREAAARLAGSARLRPDPWSPLTLREFEVARLVADGGTNAEIAESLGVARKTVASHVEHILTKLDVRRRAEIAAWAASVSGVRLRPHDADPEEQRR